jgi:hypothetical protein
MRRADQCALRQPTLLDYFFPSQLCKRAGQPGTVGMTARQCGLKVVLLSGDESWHSGRQIDYPAANVQSLNVLRMRVLGTGVHPISSGRHKQYRWSLIHECDG